MRDWEGWRSWCCGGGRSDDPQLWALIQVTSLASSSITPRSFIDCYPTRAVIGTCKSGFPHVGIAQGRYTQTVRPGKLRLDPLDR